MIDIESTFEEKQPQIIYCIIYDHGTGVIVSKHGFVGDGTGLFGPEGENERANIALENAKQHHKSEHLRAMHPPADFNFDPNVVHRVDIQTSKLVSVGRIIPAELVEKRRKKHD